MDVQHYLIAQSRWKLKCCACSKRLNKFSAICNLYGQILPTDAPTELGAFLDVHALILSDPMLSEAPLDIIRTRHYNAEWAFGDTGRRSLSTV